MRAPTIYPGCSDRICRGGVSPAAGFSGIFRVIYGRTQFAPTIRFPFGFTKTAGRRGRRPLQIRCLFRFTKTIENETFRYGGPDELSSGWFDAVRPCRIIRARGGSPSLHSTIGKKLAEPLSLVTAAYAAGSMLCGRVELSARIPGPRRLAVPTFYDREKIGRAAVAGHSGLCSQFDAARPRRIGRGASPLGAGGTVMAQAEPPEKVGRN